MNPLSHALCQKSSIPTIRHRKPSETPRAWLHRSRPQARVAAPTWRRPHLLWLLFIFLFSCALWSGKELGTSTVKPPQWQASSVPGPSKPSSVSQADRNCNLNELKTLNLSDRAFAKSKDMQTQGHRTGRHSSENWKNGAKAITSAASGLSSWHSLLGPTSVCSQLFVGSLDLSFYWLWQGERLGLPQVKSSCAPSHLISI